MQNTNSQSEQLELLLISIPVGNRFSTLVDKGEKKNEQKPMHQHEQILHEFTHFTITTSTNGYAKQTRNYNAGLNRNPNVPDQINK